MLSATTRKMHQRRAVQQQKVLIRMIRAQKPRLEDHIGLARQVAAKFCKPNNRIEDTEQYADALYGLWEAVNTYSTSMGVSFSHYAWKCINARVCKEHRWRSAKKRSIEFLPDEALDEMVVEANGTDNMPVEILPLLLRNTSSDSDMFRRSKRVLKMYFLRGLSWEEIGRRLNMTRAGARFLGMQAIHEIRNKFAHVICEY